MFGFVTSFRIAFLLFFAWNVHSQQPCTPKDVGPYLGVPPVLVMNVFEASAKDLSTRGNSDKYRSELRLYGTINSQSDDGIQIHMLDDYQFLDPKELFVAETDAVVGKSYFRLTKPLDRDMIKTVTYILLGNGKAYLAVYLPFPRETVTDTLTPELFWSSTVKLGPTEDLDDDVNYIMFTLRCVVTNTTTEKYYQVKIMIEDENDNYPLFTGTPYKTEISELQSVGTTVFRVSAADMDLNLNGNLKYGIISSENPPMDATEYFQINDTTGDVTIKKTINYEALLKDHKYFMLNVKVMDSDIFSPKSSHTEIRIDIKDADDNGPAFFYENCLMYNGLCVSPRFTTHVESLAKNVPLIIYPSSNKMGNAVHIKARDMDPSRSALQFDVVKTDPTGHADKFLVESVPSGDYYSAVIKQVRDIPQDDLRRPLELFIKAEEQTAMKRFAIATIEFVGKQNDGSTGGSNGQSSGQSEVDKTPSNRDEYSEKTIALIIVVAVLATLLVSFICITLVILCRRKSPKGALDGESSRMGRINPGYQ